MTLREYLAASTMFDEDHPRRIWANWLRLIQIATGWLHHPTPSSWPPQPRCFEPWVTSLLQLHLATRLTSVVRLGHWAMNLRLGMLELHPFLWSDWGRPATDDFCWFYMVLQHPARIVWKLWAVSFLLLARKNLALCHKLLKEKQFSRASKPFCTQASVQLLAQNPWTSAILQAFIKYTLTKSNRNGHKKTRRGNQRVPRPKGTPPWSVAFGTLPRSSPWGRLMTVRFLEPAGRLQNS